MNQTII